jgi:quercetin dioxygenase-like cupin family protein
MQNGELRIISDDYYIVKAKHTNRALHRHEGYEAFYVFSGNCNHVLVNANTEKTQKLNSGNFMILDNTVSHRFKNGNTDFCVINFLKINLD